jgi:hypothetical protein
MENDQDPPFPRQPWQGLLQDRGDSPPETTDARIRAAAQRAVAPRAARGWLPASLAASFLLAVVLVQLQFGNGDEPAVVTESDLAKPVPTQTPAAAAHETAPPLRKESAPRAVPFERPPVESAPEPEARLGGPEQDLKSASEWVEEESDPPELPPLAETDLPARDLPEAPTTAVTAESRAAPQTSGFVKERDARQRTPEAWYAEIEALRKAGRIEEADAELARFEAAYPDWPEKNHPPDR